MRAMGSPGLAIAILHDEEALRIRNSNATFPSIPGLSGAVDAEIHAEGS
jgi:hypothetical protein